MKKTSYTICLLAAFSLSGCALLRVPEKDIDLTHNQIIPRGTWAAGQVYSLVQRAYILNDSGSWWLAEANENDGLAKYEKNPAASNGYLAGVLEAGERVRVERLYAFPNSITGSVMVKGVIETGHFAGKKLKIDTFGHAEMMFGNYGIICPPDPKYLKRIR